MQFPAARVVVENRTGLHQRAFIGKDIVRLAPYEIRPLHPDVADQFFQQCKGQVQKHVGAVVPTPLPWEKHLWLANMTGNPFLAKTVKVRRVQKGEEVHIETDNPLLEAVVIRRTHGGGQQEVPKKDGSQGKELINLSRTTLVIPPYTRVCVSVDIGSWLLRRDMQQRMHHIGKLIQARPQSPFEPNEAWALYKLRFYATQILGIEEEFLGKHPRDIEGEHEDAEARSHLLRVMFFKIVDPTVNIPDEEMFNKVYNPPPLIEDAPEPTAQVSPLDEPPLPPDTEAVEKREAAKQRLKSSKGK